MGTGDEMITRPHSRSNHQQQPHQQKERKNQQVKQQLSQITTSTIMKPLHQSVTRRRGFVGRRMSLSSILVGASAVVLLFLALGSMAADEQPNSAVVASGKQSDSAPTTGIRSTQPTVERQLDTPNSVASPVVSQAPAKESLPVAQSASAGEQRKASEQSSGKIPAIYPANQRQKQQAGGSGKRMTQASHKNYDMYQLKATNSHTSVMPEPSSGSPPSVSAAATVAAASTNGAAEPSSSSSSSSTSSDSSKSSSPSSSSSDDSSSSSSSSSSVDKNKVASGNLAYKKLGYNGAAQQANGAKPAKLSSFSLLKKFLPSFMTSAAAAAAASAAVADKPYHHSGSPHSRSSSQSALTAGDGPLSKASSRIINLLSSPSKKSGYGLVPDHAPFFTRKPSIDRQAGFASSLLSNPLGLGLLFSAPLIPSLLLTPLAIAGLSPAMSAINNFFGDDEETASTPATAGPLSSVLSGSSSPLASILSQASGGSSSSGSSPSLALQAVQSFLGTPSTTEKPLFNPGMFASQGIQNAMGSLTSSISSAASGSSSGSSSSSSASGSGGSGSGSSNSPIRSFLGGNSLIQTAASMISPSFAAPPSSSSGASGSQAQSSSDSDDGPGLMQVASDVFDKMAKYMSPERDSLSQAGSSTSSISQASGNPSSSSSSQSPSSSPLSALVGLSSYSPFQLSSLFASSPFASAVAPASGAHSSSSSSSGSSGSHHGGAPAHRAGFFSTLKNVYELFSSSFLRRQEVGDSNECQQRLICEVHQRAMNSKLFRRSVQSNLMELANLDKSLQDQIRSHPLEARVDADTKALLNDFLKATNNFNNGRELVNCAKMFPRCSSAKLLSAANAHLTDPATGKTIGKFSSLMKKMRFKSAQQHQSQWKLRKPSKAVGSPSAAPAAPLASPAGQYQATDYMQVAPMSPIPSAGVAGGAKSQLGQLTPADSLKMVQQIMLMSQQQQQQQQQLQSQQQQQALSQQMPLAYTSIPAQQQVPMQQQPQQSQQQQNQMFNSAPQQVVSYYNPYSQAAPQAVAGQMTSLYTDAVPAQMYGSGSTDSPYFAMQPSQQQNQQQQQQQPQPQQQQPQASGVEQSMMQTVPQQLYNNYPQQYPTSTPTMSEHMASYSGGQPDKKVVLPSGGSLVAKTAT